jgi:hypothetical protein
MRGQVERRRGRRQYTIDQPFNGNEGWIAWYCQAINGKIYPIAGRLLLELTIPYSLRIQQVEYAHPYIFVLYDDGSFYVINTINRVLVLNFGNVKKIGIVEVNFVPHLVYLRWGILYSRPLNDISQEFTWLGGASNNLDFSVFQNRIFLLREESGKKVIYFSRQFMSAVPQIFFYEDNTSRNDFFTFAPNFFVVPVSEMYILYRNYLLTQRGVYTITAREFGGVLQFFPKLSFELPANLRAMLVQVNKNNLMLSIANQTWDETGKVYSDFIVREFFSSTALPVVANQIYSSIIDENFRIDFHNQDMMILMGNNLLWETSYGANKKLKFFKISSNPTHVIQGKLIFIYSFRNSINYKYLKKVNIKDFQDIHNIPDDANFIPVPPFPSQAHEIITEETAEQDGEWIESRGVGVYFQIEVDAKGVLPVLEVEYDEGR